MPASLGIIWCYPSREAQTLNKPPISQDLTDARNPACSPARLLALANHEKSLILSLLIRNPTTPPEALQVIASRQLEERLMRALAHHPKLSAQTLQDLAGSQFLTVQQAVAQHLNTPAPMLRALYLRGLELQRALAKNPALPTALINDLASLNDRQIEWSLASNPSTPPTVALRLAEKFPEALLKNPALTLILLERPEAISEMSDKLARAFLFMKTPPAWLWESIAAQQNKYTRINAAKHQRVPLWLLKRLSDDENETVRKAAKENPRYPELDV
jgi:hypothetical protein